MDDDIHDGKETLEWDLREREHICAYDLVQVSTVHSNLVLVLVLFATLFVVVVVVTIVVVVVLGLVCWRTHDCGSCR